MANSFLDLAIEVLKQAPKPLTYPRGMGVRKTAGDYTENKDNWQDSMAIPGSTTVC